MNKFTVGTFIACMFVSFMLGFLMCHKLYTSLAGKI